MLHWNKCLAFNSIAPQGYKRRSEPHSSAEPSIVTSWSSILLVLSHCCCLCNKFSFIWKTKHLWVQLASLSADFSGTIPVDGLSDKCPHVGNSYLHCWQECNIGISLMGGDSSFIFSTVEECSLPLSVDFMGMVPSMESRLACVPSSLIATYWRTLGATETAFCSTLKELQARGLSSGDWVGNVAIKMFPCNTWLADLPTPPVKAHVRNTPTWASSQPACKAGDVFLTPHGLQQLRKPPGLSGEQGTHLAQQHSLPWSLAFAAWHPDPLLNHSHTVRSCRNSPGRCWQWFHLLPAGRHVCSLENCNHSWLFSVPWPIWFWMCSHFSSSLVQHQQRRRGKRGMAVGLT